MKINLTYLSLVLWAILAVYTVYADYQFFTRIISLDSQVASQHQTMRMLETITVFK